MNDQIGDQLRAARQARRLSLEEVSKETHIKPHYLEALEANAFDRLPSLFQARGFLRVYSNFLGLDGEALLRQLDQQTEQLGDQAAPSSTQKEVHLPSSSFPGQNNSHLAPETTEEQASIFEEEAVDRDSPAVAEATQTSANQDTQAIFKQIGAELRHIRNHLGLSIEEVERQTHLRPHHIQILEEGAFDRLASPIQGRGLLQIYASFLGLNTETILLRYADALQARLAARQSNRAKRRIGSLTPSKGISYSWLWSAEFLLILLLSVGTIAFVLWGVSNVIRTRASLPPTPTLFSVAEALLAIEEQSRATATPLPATPTATLLNEIESPPVNDTEQAALTEPVNPTATGAVQVIISAQQRAWLRVLVDEKELYNGRIAPGSIFEYNGEEKIEIQSGNAAALKVVLNGQDLGILGSVGEVITRVFTVQGMLEPTATITPTATRTLRPTATPRPTMTLRPTRTPLPTATPSPLPPP
ncbi:MAG: hypothetical protein Kow0088_23420 [Anaerolineales bacterium]